jgi:predicted NBD/HSP70 family sugar kinase
MDLPNDMEPRPIDLRRPQLNLLRQLSDQAVLEAILRDGPITRPEIAERTGLSKPTVSEAVRRLEQSDLVRSAGARPGRRGRTPDSYAVNDLAGYVIGVDIGGTDIRVGATDIYGEFIAEESRPSLKDGARAIPRQVHALVRDVMREAAGTHAQLLALGISTPGVVDPVSSRVTSLAYNVSRDGAFDPLADLRGRFDVPMLVENDVNLSAVGEKWRGLAVGISDFVFLSIGAGVGMGIVLGDRLVRGVHGAAGEIGYLPFSSDPLARRHRVHGGFEDEVGAAGMLMAARKGPDRAGASPQSVDEVFARAASDPASRAILENERLRIGFAVATVCAILDPALVVLGGEIGSNPALQGPVRETAAAVFPLTARIETSLLGERAALQGALAIALREARDRLFRRGVRAGVG